MQHLLIIGWFLLLASDPGYTIGQTPTVIADGAGDARPIQPRIVISADKVIPLTYGASGKIYSGSHVAQMEPKNEAKPIPAKGEVALGNRPGIRELRRGVD